MAGDWLKIEVSLPDKPEVWEMAGILSIDPDAVVGKLLKVWRWFDAHTESGLAKSVPPSMIDSMVGLPGFFGALEAVGWIHNTDQGLALPGFDKHNGKTAKSRSETAKRVASHRSKPKEDPADVTNRTLLPRPIVASVKIRDSSTCVYCGRLEGQYTPPEVSRDGMMCIDHVIPVSRGGSNEINNLVCACTVCNQFKSDRTPDECGLEWPKDEFGNKFGVTCALPREEKRREEVKEERQPASPTARQLLHDVSDSVANDFIKVRKAKRAPLTETAVDGMRKQAGAAGMTLQSALEMALQRGWQSFRAEWVTGQKLNGSSEPVRRRNEL